MLTRSAAISVQQLSNAAFVQLQCHGGSEKHVHSSGRSYFGHSRHWWVALRNSLGSSSRVVFALRIASSVTNRHSRQLDLPVICTP